MGFYKNISVYDSYRDYEESELTPHVCKFPDTGFQRSWCKCGNEGLYNFQLGKYLLTGY